MSISSHSHSNHHSRAYWYTPVIPVIRALKRMRQEDSEFEVCLGWINSDTLFPKFNINKQDKLLGVVQRARTGWLDESHESGYLWGWRCLSYYGSHAPAEEPGLVPSTQVRQCTTAHTWLQMHGDLIPPSSVAIAFKCTPMHRHINKINLCLKNGFSWFSWNRS